MFNGQKYSVFSKLIKAYKLGMKLNKDILKFELASHVISRHLLGLESGT